MESLRQTFHYISLNTFEILAVVTETLTGHSENATADITFYYRSKKMQFSESLPNVFKPGLIYTGFIEVFKQDDTPLPYPSGNVTLHQFFYVKIKDNIKQKTINEVDEPVTINGFMSVPVWEPLEEIKMPPLILEIPVNGIVRFDINPFINVSQVSLKAEYKDLIADLLLEKFDSPSNTYVQVRLLTSTPKIMSKGAILTRGEFDMRSQTTRSFTLPMLHDYSPSARIVVHFVRTDGEIVADALNFDVDIFIENEVSILFNKKTAKPGEHISLKLKADPGSDVNVLAIDKAVLLLKSGNDITPKMVN
ncbi:hypothetical protein CHS0354_016723 [Potamilus streckersoni]|uniref:Alpha-2-macroglobulin bait region domain-containing protein n=1 Tax=Potamilus streckersoni TaxID=2493646 RepID=A0AAE0TD33_9BIVA|nr:hypothetical protein CHS0354_016723 [Potamilus streckersoni]